MIRASQRVVNDYSNLRFVKLTSNEVAHRVPIALAVFIREFYRSRVCEFVRQLWLIGRLTPSERMKRDTGVSTTFGG